MSSAPIGLFGVQPASVGVSVYEDLKMEDNSTSAGKKPERPCMKRPRVLVACLVVALLVAIVGLVAYIIMLHLQAAKCPASPAPVENPCASSPCKNGGQCYVGEDGYHCLECDSGFGGPRCELDTTTDAPSNTAAQAPTTTTTQAPTTTTTQAPTTTTTQAPTTTTTQAPTTTTQTPFTTTPGVICDLTLGTCSGSDSQISISKPLVVSTVPAASSTNCRYMGQIKVNFGVSPMKRAVRVEYKMEDPTGHVYHIADQQEVNGWGGTQGTEIHAFMSIYDFMSIYVAHTPDGFAEEVVTDQAFSYSNLLHNRIMDFNKHGYVRFDIKDQHVEWKDGQGTEGMDISERLFKGVHEIGDRSVWISFNRVNSDFPTDRRGVGVCSVKVTVY